MTFLPRSIDKFRAALPGGNLSGYSLDGFTGRMLENLGIAPDAFAAAAATGHVSGLSLAPWQTSPLPPPFGLLPAPPTLP